MTDISQGPNPPYEGSILAYTHLLRSPGKFYAVEILGREEDKYEWQRSGMDPQTVKSGLEQIASNTDVPKVIIAMPHVVRVYYPGHPLASRETNFYGAVFDSQTFGKLESNEIGCDAEIAILGEERRFWNEAQTVEEYLSKFVPVGSLGKVVNPNKLWEYLKK